VLANVVHHTRLEPREREVETVVEHGAREADGLRVAVQREAVDGRSARVAEPEVPGHLVEGLTGRVVDGLAEHPVVAVVLHVHEEGVPARHEQHHERELQVGLLEERGVQVSLEVVDAHERHVPGQRQGLGQRPLPRAARR
jgi:hypothetical protein